MNALRGEFQFLPPNMGVLYVRGLVTEDQIDEAFQSAVTKTVGLPYFLLIADVSQMDSQTPEARRETVKYFRQLPPFACAVIAKTFAQRVVGKFVLKASRMLDHDQGSLQISNFFKSRDLAEQWLRSKGELFEKNGSFS